MADFLITLSQAFQLVGLFPCILVVAVLALTARHFVNVIVPILFFLVMAASFVIPLLNLLASGETRQLLHGVLLFIETLAPAFSFLLIMQFLLGRLPGWPYWLVLAIPVIGGSSLVYGTLFVEELCLYGSFCMPTESIKTLYNIFAASLIFLLLIAYFSRTDTTIAYEDVNRSHKYWLIIALVLLNVQILVVELARVADRIEPKDALFIITLIRLVFVYLVLTSLFRVFDQLFTLDMTRIPITVRQKKDTVDYDLVERLEALMEKDKLYREMGMSREMMATRLDVPEHSLSKLINSYFKKNFNEFVNSYRVEEAKKRLRTEDSSITVIAFEVGFSSIASFNRVFKEQTGRSPSEFRSGK